MNVPDRIIYGSQKAETTQMPVYWVNREIKQGL